jgi:acetate kinase
VATVLALNCGSSSVKFAIFGADPAMALKCSGQIEGIGEGLRPRLSLRDAGGTAATAPEVPGDARDHAGLIAFLLQAVVEPRAGRCIAVGHRVVHGGTDFAAATLIDVAVQGRIEALIPLARSHQPHNAAGIRSAALTWPGVPQVAAFDTAFHRTLPLSRQVFALPRHFAERGLRRYGFHGLSYESVAARLPALIGARADGRVVVAHLGNGCSLAGMIGRRSMTTSMGFTPLDGLVMGRRPGRLDPGAVLWLIEEAGLAPAEVNRMLNRDSGLAGLSGGMSDMRALLEAGTGAAAFAIEVFVDRLVQEIGAAAAALGGLDALVFTGGIGENAAPVRAEAVARLRHLGLAIDPDANRRSDTLISRPDAPALALVVPTEEERVIAAHALRLAPDGGRSPAPPDT